MWLSGSVAVTRLLASGLMRPLFEVTRADGHQTMAADCSPETIFDCVPRLATPGSAAPAV